MLNHSLVPVGSTGGYSIDNSLRFNDDDSAYLSRTPSTAGNRKTWTWSGWVKRGNLSAAFHSLFSGGSSTGRTLLGFNNNQLSLNIEGYGDIKTDAVFRDSSAWYHIVFVLDTTQSTSTDRIKIYVNNEQQTLSFGYTLTLNGDYKVNESSTHRLGSQTSAVGDFVDGHLAEVNFVDGQALTPSDFGETDEDYGHWKAKKYTGTYGTNGFYLDFKDSGSLGNDANGSNNWTPNNLAATDQMLDSPTNNFCTLNPLDHGALTFSEGNLTVTNTANDTAHETRGTLSLTGKHYWEVVRQDTPGEQGATMGVCSTDIEFTTNTVYIGYYPNTSGIYGDGKHRNGSSTIVATYATQSAGSIMMFAYDADTGKFWIGKDGTWFNSGVPASGTGHVSVVPNYATKTYSPAVTAHNNVKVVANFGQDSSFAGNKTAQGNADGNGIGDFYYTPPTGYLALCTQNLPEPTVVPSDNFGIVLWTGNGGTQSITGVGFSPDLVWGKGRSYGYGLGVFDKVRGATNALETYITDAEWTQSGVTSFDSDGFTVGSTWGNISGRTQVAWNWKANGAGVSNTDGSITSTVSANVDAGFSIVSYAGGNSAGDTIGHGLSSSPELMIWKNRDISENWGVFNTHVQTLNTPDRLYLNDSSAEVTGGSNRINAVSATTITLGSNNGEINVGGNDYIMYAFHSVEGYSKVGSYTGNGSTDGTFVHCGFRPAYVMYKRTDAANSWVVFDSKRGVINLNQPHLQPHSSSAEGDWSPYGLDFLSNGFKTRHADPSMNGSGANYIFLAFAETDFKHSNAR